MAGFTIKTGNDILGPGGLEVDMTLATPEQSKLAFERAARDAQSDDERIELGYRYLAEMLRGPEPEEDEEEEEEVVAKAVKKKAPAKKGTDQRATKPVVPVFEDTNTSGLLALLLEKIEQLVDRPADPVVLLEPIPETPKAKTLTQEDVLDALRRGFDTLDIPDLGPEPVKPQHKVTFDLGRAGKISTRYHWVSQHDQGLFLIYDTRFEYGDAYEPPNLGKDVVIRVTHSGGQAWDVHSMGFVHPFGVFSIVNLVVADTVKPRDTVELETVQYD